MKDVFIVDGKRTPQVKAGEDFKDIPVPFLGSGLITHIMDKTAIPNDEVDEVIIGNTGNPAKYPNISRVIALEAGLDKSISAYTVHRNCASGMQAISEGFIKIASGRHDVILAGGVESMSQMPLLFNKEMTDFFISLMKSKSMTDKIKVATNFVKNLDLKPVVAIEQGLTDPFCGLNMGQTAEVLAREMGITRVAQDEFALNSHAKAIKAIEEGLMANEIVPVHGGKGVDKIIEQDIGPRANGNMEKMAKLRPYFDRKSGTVTVGNSCPITDGGSMLLICSEEALKKYNLTPMARIVDYHFHGLEPERMGMGPLLAMHGVLKRANMQLEQMDFLEINEAFSAQVMAVQLASKEKKWAQKFGIEAMGEIRDEILNVNGGGIALGHPVGSTGSRIVVTLANILKQKKAKLGMASMCIGGGQGGAVIIENLLD